MIDLKAFVETLNGKPVAVFGLGASGLATIEAFVKAGAPVLAWDDKKDHLEQAEKLGAKTISLNAAELKKCAFLVLAPGVPLHFPKPHDVVKAAQDAGIEVIGDLEVLHLMHHGRRTVGITGTNGKSTTTALTAHILKSSGHAMAMGGNIGNAALSLTMPKKDGTFVLEISSYQIDLCPTFRPDISVLMNITPDHLDRHGSFEDYAKAKEKMFEGEGDAIVCVDDEPSQDIYDRLVAFETGHRRVIPVSCKRDLEGGIYVLDGHLHDTTGKNIAPISLNGITTLAGVHNHQNAAAAYAICRLIGLDPQTIFAGIKTYPGLAHRQQTVRTINGVAYINDSKATNAASAGNALASYSKIYWIVGGRPKDGGLEGLEHLMGRVKHAYVIGEAMEQFSNWLGQHSVEHTNCGTIQEALNEAHQRAQALRGKPGGAGVVLLSPACASYDQFQSFEERGNVFSALVQKLPAGEVSA